MATNAGIEVTQLRPQAQVRDNYVRPEAINSGIQQGLARLSNTFNKKEQIEAKARAEEISISESLNSAEDVLDFTAYANESPAVIAHLKELRGSAWAAQWRTETEQQYNEWKANSAEDGSDYAEFMTSRKQQLADVLKGDRFLTAGALGTINETEHNMRLAHRGYLDQRARVETAERMSENMGALFQQMDAGQFSIEQVASQIDDMVQTTHDVGTIHRAKGNKAMFDSALAYYENTEDPRYLLLAKSLRYAKGANGQVTRVEAIDAIDKAQAKVEEKARVRQAYQDKIDKEAYEQQKASSMNDLYKVLISGDDPDAIQSLTISAISSGNNATTVKANVDAFVELINGDMPVLDSQESYSAALLASIQESIGNPRGVAVSLEDIMVAVGNKDIHPTQADSLLKAIESAQRVTPLLQSSLVKDFRNAYTRSLRDGAMFKNEDLSKRIFEYERGFNLAFTQNVQDHYNGGHGQPTQQELTSFANSAHQSVEHRYNEMMGEKDAYNQMIRDLKAAAKASAESTSAFTNDPEQDNVDRFFKQDDRAPMLRNLLLNDPMKILDTDKGSMPAWQYLDEIVGAGAFNIWWTANQGEFTGR